MFKNISKEELSVPATMAQLVEVRSFIEHIGKKYKIADKIVNSFKLVADETCTNIIRHGYQNVKDGKITIRAIIRRLSVTVVIIDQGKNFDPRQIGNPDLQQYVKIGKKGGLGIFMMRKLMDDIQYNLTSQGNELRLMKMREAVEEPKFMIWFNSRSLRQKYFMVTSLIMVLFIIGSYFFFLRGIESNVQKEVFTAAEAITKDFSKINYEPLREEQDLILAENAKSFQETRPEMVQAALITKENGDVIAIYPIDRDLINQKLDFERFELFEHQDVKNELTVYKTRQADTVFYYFSAPVKPETGGINPIGYALLKVNANYIAKKANNKRRDWLIFLSIMLLVGTIGLYWLVTRITQPFHKLAEWVRQVARGQVDQDEIDIDSRDEIGEIAQAFSEVTNKFREAQASVIEQQRLKKELQVAQEIQQMLLPTDFPDVVGYDITSYYQSAKEVGGDLFDFMEVDDQSIGICVADVSGKGIPGSLVMTMIRTSLRLETRGNKNPADILTKVNGFVTDDIRRGMFVTMFYVILDSRERMVSFASAGHNPMILFRGKSKETYYLNPSGFPVGITLPEIHLFGERIQADRIRLHPDDILVLYTDGITEAMNPQRELYGDERFLAAIRKYGDLDVVEFVKSIKSDILAFTGGFEQNDDITLVAIKENMAAVDVKVDMFKRLFEGAQSNNSMTISEACKNVGISQSTFYRYRRIYEEGGYDLLREMLHGYTNLGLRHMSVELKTKMYDIIQKHPEYGPKKISDKLNTREYSFSEISPLLIYEELRRAKLNTRDRREAFVKRGGKRRLKPPGTPLLTLDGEVLVGFRSEDQADAAFSFPVQPIDSKSDRKERIISSRDKGLKSFPADKQPPKASPTAKEQANKSEREKLDTEEVSVTETESGKTAG